MSAEFLKIFKMADKQYFTREEIIRKILVEDQTVHENKTVSADPKEAISSAVQELWSLRSQMSNFVAFEEEASRSLTTIFEKWQQGRAVTDRILRSTIEVGSLIAEEVNQWLKIIHRRLSPRMKALNAWTINFTRYLSWDVFAIMKQVILKSSTRYGILVQQTDKEEIITFTNMKRALRDLEKFAKIPRSEISTYFSKICRGQRKGKITVIITPEKPLEVRYIKRKNDVIITCHYSFENEFGYVFS